jgi:hypothetical protein
MLDEKAKRRECCDPANSVPVKLADGQEWLFPKPWLEIHASFAGGRPAGSYPIITAGPELDELVEAIGRCEDNAAVLSGAATLGAHLLCRNYDLTDEDLDHLFAFRPADPTSWDWARELIGIATGRSGTRSFRGGGA